MLPILGFAQPDLASTKFYSLQIFNTSSKVDNKVLKNYTSDGTGTRAFSVPFLQLTLAAKFYF